MANRFLIGVLIVFLVNYHSVGQEDDRKNEFVVLELFTSQGCSSCPAADALLMKVSKNNPSNIYALSYHVDYWNYIGWKDPFSQSTFSEKQRKYGQKFGSSSIYTPQLVINGSEHFVGSNSAVMSLKINQYKKNKLPNAISITDVISQNGEVTFNYSINGSIENNTLRVLMVIDERITWVKAGENAQRTLKNSNIVAKEVVLNAVKNEGRYKITIPKIIEKTDAVKLVLLMQDENLTITGAAKASLNP